MDEMNSQLEFHLRAYSPLDVAQAGGNKNGNFEATMRNEDLVMPHSADRLSSEKHAPQDDEAKENQFGLTFRSLRDPISSAVRWITLVGVGIATESYCQLTILTVRLEISSLTMAGRRHFQIPVSIVLLLLMFLLSYFSLAFIQDFLCIILGWSNSDGSNTSLETISKQNYKHRQQQLAAVRLKIFKLVGSIQAPFLHQQMLDLHQNDNTTDESSCLNNQLKRYHESSLPLWVGFAHAHSTLIQTVDRAVGIMKLGTALQLGATGHAVERIERALFGTSEHRQSRNQNVNSDGFPELRRAAAVSFATLRRLVTQVMDSQAKSLLGVALSLEHSSDRVTSFGKKRNEYVSGLAIFGRLPKVVTLTRLRSSQQEISELLSHVLHKGVLAMGAGDQHSVGGKLLQNSTARAYELQQYLQSSMGTSTIGRVSASNITISYTTDIRQSSSALEQCMLQTKLQLQNLYVALLALQAEASRLSLADNHNRDDDEDRTNDATATAIPTASSLKNCWDGVQQCSHSLYRSMQNMDEIFSQKWHDGDSLNETAESFTQNGKHHKELRQT